MTNIIKKTVIILGTVFLAGSITLGGLYVAKIITTNSQDENISNITSKLPTFTEIKGVINPPAVSYTGLGDSWTPSDLNNTKTLSFKNTSSNCTISVNSFMLPVKDKSLKDYELSKRYLKTLVDGEGGTLKSESTTKIMSNKGDVDLLIALQEVINGPSQQGGNTSPSTQPTSVIAVRIISNQAVDDAKTSSDAKSNAGIVTLNGLNPAVVFRYMCAPQQVNEDVAIQTIKNFSLNFSARSEENSSSTTGK